MSETPARLWLIRHGETDWNVLGRVQGHTPTSLNDAGRRQACVLADIFKTRAAAGGPFAAIWSSDLPRAYETADAIAAALHLTVQRTLALRERSFGPYEGAAGDAIRIAREQLGLPQNNDLADWTGMPGIESNDALWSRIDSQLRLISAQHPAQDVIVVTHGGVVARAIYRTLGIIDGVPRRFPLSNGMTAIVEWRAAINAWYLLTLADLSLVTAGSSSSIDTATLTK